MPRYYLSLALSLAVLASASCSHSISSGVVAEQQLIAIGYVRDDLPVRTLCQRGSTLYGLRDSDLHYVLSNDLGNNWSDTGSSSLAAAGAFQQCFFLHGFKFLLTSEGKLFRSAPDDWLNWTEISPPARPPGTTGRPDVFAGNSSYLFYGNYNDTVNEGAHVFRSADDGVTWIEVLNVATARHVHAIAIDPLHPDRVFVNLGDKGGTPPEFPGYGLWYSPNGNPGSFVHLSDDNDGIDLLFHRPANLPARILMEGDGPLGAMILDFLDADSPQPGPSMALITGPENPPDGKGSLQGTGRCIAVTSEGDLFWITKAEGAADRHRAGIWMSKGPSFDRIVLLEETSTAFTISAKTLEVGPYLFFGNHRVKKPILQIQ